MGALMRCEKPGARASYGTARGVLGGVETYLLALGAVSVLALGAMIVTGVLLREFSTTGFPDEVVIAGELMVGALILPLAFVAADRGFIAVEVLTNRFGPRVQCWLNVLTAVVGLLGVVPITYAGYLELVEAVHSGSYFFGLLEWPEWPGRLLFFGGYIVFLIRLLDLLAHDTLMSLGLIQDPEDQAPQDHTMEDPA